MSSSISRQQLGNRKRSTRMKRNFLVDEEEELAEKKKKQEKEEGNKGQKEFISSEDIIHPPGKFCQRPSPLRGLDWRYDFNFMLCDD